MKTRHGAIYLDIDETLLIQINRKHKWLGGDNLVFYLYLHFLFHAAQNENIKLHLGIATMRPGKKICQNTGAEKPINFMQSKTMKLIMSVLGNLLDPELVFHVGVTHPETGETLIRSKGKEALLKGKEYIEEKYATELQDQDQWLIDNDPAVCEDVRSYRFSVASAEGLEHSPTAQQINKIHKIFTPIFRHFNVLYALPPLPQLFKERHEFRENSASKLYLGQLSPGRVTKLFSLCLEMLHHNSHDALESRIQTTHLLLATYLLQLFPQLEKLAVDSIFKSANAAAQFRYAIKRSVHTWQCEAYVKLYLKFINPTHAIYDHSSLLHWGVETNCADYVLEMLTPRQIRICCSNPDKHGHYLLDSTAKNYRTDLHLYLLSNGVTGFRFDLSKEQRAYIDAMKSAENKKSKYQSIFVTQQKPSIWRFFSSTNDEEKENQFQRKISTVSHQGLGHHVARFFEVSGDKEMISFLRSYLTRLRQAVRSVDVDRIICQLVLHTLRQKKSVEWLRKILFIQVEVFINQLDKAGFTEPRPSGSVTKHYSGINLVP